MTDQRPEPVLDAANAAAKLSAAYKAVLAVIALINGGIGLADVDGLVQAIVGAVSALGAVAVIVAGYVGERRKGTAARDAVTPVADPRDDSGEPLVPPSEVAKAANNTDAAIEYLRTANATPQVDDELLARARQALAKAREGEEGISQ